MTSVLRRSFWKSLWFAVLRSRKDRRARFAVLSVILALAWIVGEAWVIFVLPAREGGGVFQMIFNGFAIGSGFIAALLLRRSNRKQDEILNFSITGRYPQPLPEQVSSDVRRYLEGRAVILASLLARAASEVYILNNQLPPGAEVVTRQIQNTLLRKMGLWEQLDRHESELAMAADGLWTPEQRNEVITWCEQLRLLRRTLGIDAEVIPLAHNPSVDFSIVRDLLRDEPETQKEDITRASWDLRSERDIALEYFARIVAELKGRSPINNSAELEGWADDFREKSMGASVDYLAGSRTIGEMDEDPLRLLGMTAHARAQYAGYLVDLLSSAETVAFAEWSVRDQS